MATARAQLAEALSHALPSTYTVLPYGKELDNIETGRVVVMVRRLSLRPGKTFNTLTNQMVVQLVIPNMDPERVDDLLDEALDEVLPILADIKWLTWESVEKAVTSAEGGFYAYEISCSIETEKE